MKKILILALCLMAATTLKAQYTITVNGQQCSQNDTIHVPFGYAHVVADYGTINVDYMERVYVGVTAYFSGSADFLVNKKPRLLRINYFSSSKRIYSFRVWVVR